ncbi:MAG: MBL fold metallo-hydrolase [Bacteroidota bacterium]|nr:MBL fold metallo-hydrolase [Bacteroidota bacterium]
MIKVTFKNVGQGDSIIIEWNNQGKDGIGIIDCNKKNRINPTVNYLKEKSISNIDFILLSHFHYDHFSGMPELFDYLYYKNISVKFFLHTLSTANILKIYDKISKSKKVEVSISKFFKSFEKLNKNYIHESNAVNSKTECIPLTETIKLQILGPRDYIIQDFSKKINKVVEDENLTYDDINKFGTVLCISNNSKSILLTSDAIKRSFNNLEKVIKKECILTQVPHHGSKANINNNFWKNLKRKKNCPSVFSVGDNPKDKLPDIETVEFFDDNGYDIHSTNFVYGLKEFFDKDTYEPCINEKKISLALDAFSKQNERIETEKMVSQKYNGDQVFVLNDF